MSRARAWLLAARVPTLAAAVVPVAVGSALAARDHHFRLGPAIAALWGAVFIQIGTNLVNDLGDFRRGADSGNRLGPPRALAMGWLTVGEIRTGILVSFLCATLAGVYLVGAAGWIVVAIGLASIAAGVAYTAGPAPLAYNGLGEVFVFLFFGVVAVCGTYYVEAGTLPLDAVLAAIPVGALAAAILVVNNVRDLEGDRAAGKRTMAVTLGRRGARAEYLLLLAAAYLTPALLTLSGRARAWALLPLFTAPLALLEGRRVLGREDGPGLNAALFGTARLHVLFGLLFALGMAIA
ncbi:MAG TPA: 1,4-dihydroxy-2-naphthoate polyprenyltransferase [Candidatus Limnocylindrales bacterium]|nr:1,4-dihydroxy-2-naphthoate polyprenyltransferase [Candidatus Limnocylindrales bacterium]